MKVLEITITQTLKEDGTINTTWHLDGDQNLVHILGVIEMTKMNILGATYFGGEDE